MSDVWTEEAMETPPENTATLTFARPCTLCGGDIHVVNGERQRHTCSLPRSAGE